LGLKTINQSSIGVDVLVKKLLTVR